jgi:hypothetical protein
MNTLPVWIADWQLGCCGDEHVAAIGELWSEVMLLRPSTLERSTRAPGWIQDGQQIEFTGTIVAPAPGVLELDMGVIRLGLEGWSPDPERWATMIGQVVGGVGSVHADWHTTFHPDFDDEVTVEGVVRKISTVKAILERTGDREVRVVGHEAPVEINDWPPRFCPDVVLELEIASG